MNAEIHIELEKPENASEPNERELFAITYRKGGRELGYVSTSNDVRVFNTKKCLCFVGFLLRCANDPTYQESNPVLVEKLADYLKNVGDTEKRTNHSMRSLFTNADEYPFDPVQSMGPGSKSKPEALFEAQRGGFFRLARNVSVSWEDLDSNGNSLIAPDLHPIQGAAKTAAVANWFYSQCVRDKKPRLQVAVKRGNSQSVPIETSGILPIKVGDKLSFSGQLAGSGKYFCLLWIDPDSRIKICRPNERQDKSGDSPVKIDGDGSFYMAGTVEVCGPEGKGKKPPQNFAALDTVALITFTKRVELAEIIENLSQIARESIPTVDRNDGNREPIERPWRQGDDLSDLEVDTVENGPQARFGHLNLLDDHVPDIARPRVFAFYRAVFEKLETVDGVKHAVLNSNVSIAP